MKKISLLLILVTFISSASLLKAQNQIPNGSFSNWTNDSTPVSWNGVIPLFITDLYTAQRTSDAHSAPSACKITAKQIPYIGTILSGCMSLGRQDYDIMNFAVACSGGTPISVKPTKLKGYYKYAFPAKDTFEIAGICLKGIDTIATGSFSSSIAQSAYTYFEFTFNYTITQTPDTINIICISSSGSSPQMGTTLYVDDLLIEYAGSGGPETISVDDLMNAYPNPCKQFINVGLSANEDNVISIFDVSGRKMFSKTSLLPLETINMQDYQNGIYMIEVQNNSGRYMKKIVLAR